MQIKFHMRQNENCSPGDSTSDSSEKMLQRDVEWLGRGGHYISDFGEGGLLVIKHISLQKLSLVSRNSHHHEGS